ncbi:tRNA glutamyl-Q(34) synthetase GluQRS [Neptunicella sp. SCSIO 80796]|uniref:tRNA glutamyl-Q(34) synthetase GluQRS n=1 Tax=Neptunicella plasticusilytica TaxID=3117012 RepID=UPI003A4DE90E
MISTAPEYRGRFAPSPSGPLHLGSLVAALGSFLQARCQSGRWLVRIEDIDPPREVSGAADSILTSLEAHGLLWDESVEYQSRNSSFYDQHLDWLAQQQLTYWCDCTRKMIQQQGGHYQGYCRNRKLDNQGCALRIRNNQPVSQFNDLLQGKVCSDMGFASEDFIVKRKDGLYAYHLAVVVDDIRQRISHIVRGADLLQPTACQIMLYRLFNQPVPEYLHLPVIVSQPGLKLSKQNHAPALDNDNASGNLSQVLSWLNHPPPQDLHGAPCAEILQWAIEHWQLSRLPTSKELQQ